MEGEEHKRFDLTTTSRPTDVYWHIRQRKALSSAFTNSTTMDFASVFFNSSYKVRKVSVYKAGMMKLLRCSSKLHGIRPSKAAQVIH